MDNFKGKYFFLVNLENIPFKSKNFKKNNRF